MLAGALLYNLYNKLTQAIETLNFLIRLCASLFAANSFANENDSP